tara:strand:+ start:1664 stop:2368 length:705 start_codon:yes stop_codon:yes gene_type:complete
MNSNTIVNVIIGAIALAALIIGIINLCTRTKENIDTQVIALKGLKPYTTDLESLSISDTIEQWLSDRGVTFDSGVNINKPLNCTDAKFSSVTSTGAGDFGAITATGAGSFGSVSSTGTGSFGDVTTTGNVTATGSGTFTIVNTDRIVSLAGPGDSAISLSAQLISLENYKSNGMIRAMCWGESSVSPLCTDREQTLATASDHGSGWDGIGTIPGCNKTQTMSAAYTNGQGPRGA